MLRVRALSLNVYDFLYLVSLTRAKKILLFPAFLEAVS